MESDLKPEADEDEIFEIVFTMKSSWSCQHCRFNTSSGLKASKHLFDKHVKGGKGKKLEAEEQQSTSSPRKKRAKTRWNCIECEDSFSTRSLLVKHLKKAHPATAVEEEEDEDSEVKFRCSVCNKGFQKRKFHQLHEPFCTVELQCQHCDKTFHKKSQPYNKFRYNFRLHESACSLKPAKELRCRFCRKEFSTPHNCKQHMEMNCPAKKDKPHTCMYCREVFDSKLKLDKHFGACQRRQRKLKQRRRRNNEEDREQEEELTAEAHEKDFLPPMEAMPTNSGERTAASMEDDLDSSAKEAENTNEDLVPPVDVVGDNAAGFVESQFDSQDPFSDSLECR